MSKAYLIAVDLEGVHGIVGTPFQPLSRGICEAYDKAVAAAEQEVNAAVQGLFESDAGTVAVWDNHGGGGNLRFDRLDPRILKIDPRTDTFRFDFLQNHCFDGILFLGYHAREGAPRGILAHSYSSTNIQYIRLNGEDVGELAVDSLICTEYGLPPVFIAGDDVCVAELGALAPGIRHVITKYGQGRNRGVLRPDAQVLEEIRTAVTDLRACPVTPMSRPSLLEIRYTRAERAEAVWQKYHDIYPLEWGRDTHTLLCRIEHPNQIPKLL